MIPGSEIHLYWMDTGWNSGSWAEPCFRTTKVVPYTYKGNPHDPPLDENTLNVWPESFGGRFFEGGTPPEPKARFGSFPPLLPCPGPLCLAARPWPRADAFA